MNNEIWGRLFRFVINSIKQQQQHQQIFSIANILFKLILLLRHDKKIYLKKWCFSLSRIDFWHSGHKTLSTLGDGDNNNCAVCCCCCFLWIIILCVYVGGIRIRFRWILLIVLELLLEKQLYYSHNKNSSETRNQSMSIFEKWKDDAS